MPNRIRLAVCALAVPALLTRAAVAQVGTGDFRYELVKTDLTVNEPVFLRFSVNNQMADGIVVDMEFNVRGYGGFQGKIIRPDGREDQGPKPELSEIGAVVRPHIAPGGSFGVVLLLNKWFAFDVPGRYALDIQTTRPIVTDSGVQYTYPLEASVVINVGPRDPERLRHICQEFVEKDSGPSSRPLTPDAAEVIAGMRDPIAVPYLARLFKDHERGVGPVVTDALARIGGDAAVDALISHLDSSDPDTRNMVRGALGRIAPHTDDPMIKQKISDALR